MSREAGKSTTRSSCQPLHSVKSMHLCLPVYPRDEGPQNGSWWFKGKGSIDHCVIVTHV